jgi:hypothetical protein
MLHCHVLQHMLMVRHLIQYGNSKIEAYVFQGMSSVWIMGEWEQIASIPYSGAEGYLEFNGTARGGQDISPVEDSSL